jgi:hypothetical protein
MLNFMEEEKNPGASTVYLSSSSSISSKHPIHTQHTVMAEQAERDKKL